LGDVSGEVPHANTVRPGAAQYQIPAIRGLFRLRIVPGLPCPRLPPRPQ
jgi:hypothetical protein